MYDAIVIGAGYAGLAAARQLHDAGKRVLVCEARDRIGGRVWSTPIDGYPLELGAEWIHGDNVATWQWVRRLGLTTTTAPLWQGRRIWHAGALHTPSELAALAPMVAQLVSIEDEIAAYVGPDISFATWLHDRGYTGIARHLADIRLAHSAATTPERASLYAIRDEIVATRDIGGDDHHIATGYAPITADLATALDIRLECAVVAVTDMGAQCTITTADGAVLQAAHVIVTVPLALLKAGTITFTPPLPAAKRAAIDALDMHDGAKVIMRFTHQFWDAQASFISLFDPAPVWWTMSADAPFLLGFFTGPRAEYLRQHPDPQEMCLEVLCRVFGEVARTALCSCQVMIWSQEEWSRGAYSSTPVGAFGLREALAAPYGRMHFAGEATALHGQAASVHGAIVSGQRAATEVEASHA